MNGRTKNRRAGKAVRRLALTLACCTAAGAAPGAAFAQQRASEHRFQISRQPLSSALTQLARQAKMQLFAPQLGEAGRQVRKLDGRYSVDAALKILLAGSNLDYRLEGNLIILQHRGDGPGGGAATRGGVRSSAPEAPRQTPAASGEAPEVRGAALDSSDADFNRADIVVTAQKREERLLDVPLAVSAFTEDFMERMDARQLADFLYLAPGVTITDSGDGTQGIQIRGISAFAGDATIGYYLDELPFTLISVAAVPDVRMFDIERVEVLRGPQGTLYGDGSIGGTVRILTANPKLDRFEAKADALYSSTRDGGDNYAVRGAVNVPIVTDRVGIRLVGSYEDYSGWVDAPNLNRRDVNGRKIENFRGKILLKPTDRLSLTLSAWKVSEDVDSGSSSTPDRTSLRVVPPSSKIDYTLYSGVLEYDFGSAQLLSASSYMDYDRDAIFEFLARPATLRTPVKNFTQEVRLNSKGAGPFQWTAGAFYRDLKSDQFTELPSFGTLFLKADSKSWAIFGEASHSLLDDKVKATLGLRYFEDKRARQDVGSVRRGAKYSNVNPRFNLAYQPNRNWLTYVNVAKGFRTGQIQAAGVLSLAQAVGIEVPVGVDPETLWTYELGTKWSAPNNSFTLEAAIYRNDWSDMQLPISIVPNTIAALLNVGKARVQGFDFVATARPVKGLSVTFSGNVNDAVISKEVRDTTGVVFRKGARIPGVPAYAVNMGVSYDWLLAGSGNAGSDLRGSVRADMRFNSERPGSGFGVAAESDDFTQIDVRAGVENDRWGLFAFVSNLTDSNAALEAVTLAGAATRPRPRTIGLNLRARY